MFSYSSIVGLGEMALQVLLKTPMPIVGANSSIGRRLAHARVQGLLILITHDVLLLDDPLLLVMVVVAGVHPVTPAVMVDGPLQPTIVVVGETTVEVVILDHLLHLLDLLVVIEVLHRNDEALQVDEVLPVGDGAEGGARHLLRVIGQGVAHGVALRAEAEVEVVPEVCLVVAVGHVLLVSALETVLEQFIVSPWLRL